MYQEATEIEGSEIDSILYDRGRAESEMATDKKKKIDFAFLIRVMLCSIKTGNNSNMNEKTRSALHQLIKELLVLTENLR